MHWYLPIPLNQVNSGEKLLTRHLADEVPEVCEGVGAAYGLGIQ